MLSGAIFFARPRSGIAAELTGDGSGSVMARRFLPAVFAVPLLLGWICLKGQLAGLYGFELGLAIYGASNVSVLAGLVWLNARRMNLEHSQRAAAEAGILQLNAELERRVAQRTRALEQQTAVLGEQAELLNLAHDAIVVRDMANRIVFWNRGAEIMYGWPPDSALGNNAVELLKPQYSQPIEEINERLIQQGYWESDVIHHKKDGARLNVATRWTVQFDTDGAPARVFAIDNDITDRKQAESKLRLLTERLSLATQVAKAGVWDWDLASNTITWDATMFEIYGLPTVVPMPYGKWADALHPDDLQSIEAAMRRVNSEKGQGFAEYRITLPKGGIRYISAAWRVLLDERLDVVRVIGVNTDITERKEAEKALRHSEAQLTYSAQHDFLTGLPNRMLLNDRVNQAIIFTRASRKKSLFYFWTWTDSNTSTIPWGIPSATNSCSLLRNAW